MNPISTFEPTIGAHVHGRGRSAAAGSAHQFFAAAGASLPFMWLAAAVALATLAGLVLTSFARLPNVSMVFLLAVLFAAARFRLWPALLASGFSFLSYNFFFIEPLHTLSVGEPQEWLALFVLLAVAVLTPRLETRCSSHRALGK